MKKTIFETAFGQNYNLSLLAKQAGSMLETVIETDYEQNEYLYITKGVNLVINSPVRSAFTLAKEHELLDKVYYVSTVGKKHISLPELLTIREVTVNGAQVPTVHDDKLKKAWVEVSQCFQASRERGGRPELKAPVEYASMVLRGLLCTGYDQTTNWLTDKSQAFIIEVYSRMLTNELNRIYKFDNTEYVTVAYGFAYYLAALLSDKVDDNNAPVVLNRINQLTKAGNVELKALADKMFAVVGDHTKKPFGLDSVVEYIKRSGPSRLSDLNTTNIYRKAFTSSRNNISTYIAMDYPPYLVYLLLRVGGGEKHPMLNAVLERMGGSSKSAILAEIDQLAKDSNLLKM